MRDHPDFWALLGLTAFNVACLGAVYVISRDADQPLPPYAASLAGFVIASVTLLMLLDGFAGRDR